VAASGHGLVLCVLAADPQLEKLTSPIPEAVSTNIREALNPEGFQVRVEGKVVGGFWLRREIPVKEFSTMALGVNFGTLREGTLVAVAHFPTGWSDYKGKPVHSGVYTLRYGIRPVDGNHMGVSLYRDFLLLILASTDREVDGWYSHDQLSTLSQETSGTSHPAVLSLFPVSDTSASPSLTRNELDQWVIEATVGPLGLGLVVVGKGGG
jgi:hypothetical protein